MNKYLIIIDNQTMNEYGQYYKQKHPKSRKHPFGNKKNNVKPYPPSINEWMVMIRPQMNSNKQKWKEFIVWLINKYKLTNKKINKAIITFTYYFKTRVRHDADNYAPKNIMDGFTKSGLLVDDDFSHIEMLCIKGGYDKNNPRTEILIEELE